MVRNESILTVENEENQKKGTGRSVNVSEIHRDSDGEDVDDSRVLSDRIKRNLDGNNNSYTLSPRRTPNSNCFTARTNLFSPLRARSQNDTSYDDDSVRREDSRRINEHHQRPPAKKIRHLKRKCIGGNQLESRTKKVRHSRDDSEEFYEHYWSDDSIGETQEFGVFQEWTEDGSEDTVRLCDTISIF